MTDAVRPALYAVGFALAIVLLWTLRDLVALVTFAVLLAYLLDPPVSGLQRLKLGRRTLGRGPAAALVILSLGALLAWSVAWGAPRLAAEFGRFLERAPATLNNILDHVESYARARGLGPYLEDSLRDARGGAAEWLGHAGRLLGGSLGKLAGSLGQLLGILLLPLLAFYLLAESEAVQASALNFVPQEARGRLRQGAAAVDRALRSYVRGQSAVCVVMGLAIGAAMTLLGLPLPLLLGVLAGVAEVLPFLGAWLAAAAIALTGYSVSPQHMILGVLAYVAVNYLVGLLVTPRLMGRHLKMHPFVVTVSILAGGHLMGPPGAMLALPAAATTQALIAEFAPRPRPKPTAEDA